MSQIAHFSISFGYYYQLVFLTKKGLFCVQIFWISKYLQCKIAEFFIWDSVHKSDHEDSKTFLKRDRANFCIFKMNVNKIAKHFTV